jgi:hypothetical protein
MRVEARQIVLDHRRRVPFRIDGDEHRVYAVGLRPKRAQDLRHLEQGRRTDVGAIGEAEEHQGWASPSILIGDHFPVHDPSA